VHGDGHTGLRRSLPRWDRRYQHLAQLVVDALVGDRWITAIERLKAAGEKTGHSEESADLRG
jgi:hypothetical protein